ncbi:MAG: tetratricopeptide repeat protein [Gallionella sp.]|nr:tetratricopeptide repeat protein [Gallionella sp.]
MNIAKHFLRNFALIASAILLCAVQIAHADEYVDASLLYKKGQSNQALEKVNKYLAARPKDAQARFLKGLILTEQGKTADAMKIFSDLTADYPDLPEPYNNLAVLYASQGKYDKAKQLLEKAISTHPSYATAHENLGDIYAKLASQAYDRALQLDNKNTATQTKLAMIQNLFAADAGNNVNVASAAAFQGKSAAAKAEPAAAPPKTAPETATLAKAAPALSTPAIAETPIKAVAATPAKAAARKDSSAEVTSTVTSWAKAWSSQDANQYLSFYANDFRTPGGETRAAWEAVRRERLGAPKYIDVGIRIRSIAFKDSQHATVKFHQSYRASNFKASGNKTLLMVNSGGKWLIQEERSR